MKETTNYNLKKIELTDSPPDITVHSGNFDVIDAELKKQDEETKSHKAEFAKLGSQVMGVARDVQLEGVQRITTINKAKSIFIIANSNNRISFGMWSEVGAVYATVIKLIDGFIGSMSDYGEIAILETPAGAVKMVGRISNVTETGFDITWVKHNSFTLTGNISLRFQVFYG